MLINVKLKLDFQFVGGYLGGAGPIQKDAYVGVMGGKTRGYGGKTLTINTNL